MELKVFRDVLPAAGADCTAKAELPLETELLMPRAGLSYKGKALS